MATARQAAAGVAGTRRRAILAVAAALALAAFALSSASARAAASYDLTGTWETTAVSGGGSTGSFTITKMDLATGKFSGTGVAGLALAGTETGDAVTFTQTTGSYVSHDSATLERSGGYLEMVDGKWHDSNGNGGTFAARLKYSGASGGATPVLAQSVAGAAVSGAVTVERPGTHRFVTLSKPGLIPVGSLVNATHGRVELTVAGSSSGATHTGQFYDGEFRVGQSQSGLATLTLAGGTPCAATATAAKTRPPARRRRLWGSAHGSFQTIGTDAAATELGTAWLTQDTCTGTLIRVTSGAVRVTNLVTHHSLVLRAPHSYVAKRAVGS